jgi:uncharacterized protein (TIGR03083 family)
MIARSIATERIPAIGHDVAMRLARVESERLLALADDLHEEAWLLPTDCPDWTVRDMLGHVLGMLELQADGDERMRQIKAAAGVAAQTGVLRIDAMTAMQVREHAALSPDALRVALRDTAPGALAGRSATTAEQRAAPFPSGLPGEDEWTFGYLFDVVLTRDLWIHRVDISRATERELVLSADHDGRIVADLVADWARRHRQPFTLTLTGPAGDRYSAGSGGAELALDAIEFCRVLSGRAPGAGLLATGLLATSVPF